jgi:hypothetical protein
MEKRMKMLPTEIIDLIFEYQGYHRWRNGKYICRLHMYDTYDALKHIPIIQKDVFNIFNITFTKIRYQKICEYTIHTAIYSSKIHWYMDKLSYHLNDHNKDICVVENIHYVFGHNEKKHLPMIKV